jgi:hypothetical protein
MGTLRRLTPAQLADAADRQRCGRIDKSVLTNEERRLWGLMDRHQAAEHERLAAFPHSQRADRSRGPAPDDIWAGGEGS